MKAIVEQTRIRKRRTSTRLLVTLVVFAILLTLGLINLYSAAGEATLRTQLRHLIPALLLFVGIGWVIPLRMINTYSYIFYSLTVFFLIAVLVLGYIAGGAQRWLILGPLRFQPSELAKLSIALFVAKHFYNNRTKLSYQLTELWPVLIAVGAYFVLIFIQPDFGTAGVCLLIALTQVAFIKVSISRGMLLSLLFSGLGMIAMGWQFLLRPYQKLRILNLFNPALDPSGSGYNSLQSLVAVGSGGQWGKGFLHGTQAQLQFLPARQTDFIFSVFAEEQGFWGGALIFVLFAILSYAALEIAREAKDTFNTLLAIGIGALIFLEFFINVAMVIGIFPVVGMPLPFFSYGGSFLLTICAAMGLLVAVERDTLRS
ncbi:MAG: rod shape-determining protein RodA [Deltaproteobacteria bacterium]|nr:rod shape-determining protein RodA [Deltaproteobacteria bacterium]